MKILLTGVNGRVGKHLSAFLREQGAEVVGVSRRSEESTVCAADLAVADDLPKVAEFIAQQHPDVVIHLAGVVANDDPNLFAVNTMATGSLARASAAAGVRKFIYASSAGVYGDQGYKPYHEDTYLAGKSNYAQSKIQGEQVLAQVQVASNLEVICARIFNIYGPGFQNSLVNKLIASAQPGGTPVSVHSPEAFVRDYVHVSQVVESLWKLLQLPGSHTVNVANGYGWNNTDLVAHLQSHNLNANIAWGDSTTHSYSVADVTRLSELTDFQPQADIILD